MASHHVLMLPATDENGASTRCRVLAHRRALGEAGFTTEVRFPSDLGRTGLTRVALRAVDVVRDVYGGDQADLLFVHRKTYPAALAPRLRRDGRPLIFDMDDALDLPPPGAEVGEAGKERFRRNFEATVDVADLVLCGNQYLASRLPHDRYEIVPTPVDTNRFEPEAVSRPTTPTLGWVGFSDNLRYLESLGDPLREVAARHPGLKLIVVADRQPSIAGIDVVFRRWSLETELSDFDDIAVGLMPLADDAWCRGKCGLKAIQYMALGIPAVASPVGTACEIIDDGDNGYLARDDREWVDALDGLLSDTRRAREVGAKGRRSVEERFSLDVVSAQIVELLAMLFHDGAEVQWWHGPSDGLVR